MATSVDGSTLPAIKIDYARNPDVIKKWKRTERRLAVVALPKVMFARRKRIEAEELKRKKLQEFTKLIQSLPKITVDILTTTEDHFFPPPEQTVDEEIAEFERFASVHKEYEFARQYLYGLNTLIGYRSYLLNSVRRKREEMVTTITPLEAMYEEGKRPTYRTFHGKVKETMRKFCTMNFEMCEKCYLQRAKQKNSGPPQPEILGLTIEDLGQVVELHKKGIARVDGIIHELKSRTDNVEGSRTITEAKNNDEKIETTDCKIQMFQ